MTILYSLSPYFLSSVNFLHRVLLRCQCFIIYFISVKLLYSFTNYFFQFFIFFNFFSNFFYLFLLFFLTRFHFEKIYLISMYESILHYFLNFLLILPIYKSSYDSVKKNAPASRGAFENLIIF